MNDLTLYYKYQKDIRTGDGIGYRGDYIVSNLVREFTDDSINHIEIAIRLQFPGLELRRFNIGALNRGIELRKLSSTLQNYKGQVFWYPLKSLYSVRRPYIASWIIDKIGVKYGYFTLFKMGIKKCTFNINTLICSEAANGAWHYGGKINTGFDKYIPSPADIDKFKIFEDKIRIL